MDGWMDGWIVPRRYCYLNSETKWAPWVFLYGPIILLYFFALGMTLSNLYGAYSRYASALGEGGERLKLPTTFATHLHVLAINNVNLVAVTLFWFLCGFCFATSYLQLGWHNESRGALLKGWTWADWKEAIGYVCSYAAALLRFNRSTPNVAPACWPELPALARDERRVKSYALLPHFERAPCVGKSCPGGVSAWCLRRKSSSPPSPPLPSRQLSEDADLPGCRSTCEVRLEGSRCRDYPSMTGRGWFDDAAYGGPAAPSRHQACTERREVWRAKCGLATRVEVQHRPRN